MVEPVSKLPDWVHADILASGKPFLLFRNCNGVTTERFIHFYQDTVDLEKRSTASNVLNQNDVCVKVTRVGGARGKTGAPFIDILYTESDCEHTCAS